MGIFINNDKFMLLLRNKYYIKFQIINVNLNKNLVIKYINIMILNFSSLHFKLWKLHIIDFWKMCWEIWIFLGKLFYGFCNFSSNYIVFISHIFVMFLNFFIFLLHMFYSWFFGLLVKTWDFHCLSSSFVHNCFFFWCRCC